MGIIRTCLGFHIPTLAPPRDKFRTCSYFEGEVAYIMLPMRGNFHRLESTDAADL
jgi:hypothetical protein